MAQVQVSDLTEILELKNVDFFHIKDGNDNIDKKFAFSNFLLPASNPTKQTVDSLGDAAFQDIVPVSMGGTGADNQATARNNLGLTSAATTDIGVGEGDLAILGLNGFFSVNRIPNLDASKITSGVLSNTILPTDIVRTSRTLTGGTGINTIGDLSEDRTISVDSSVAIYGIAEGQVRTNAQNNGWFAQLDGGNWQSDGLNALGYGKSANGTQITDYASITKAGMYSASGSAAGRPSGINSSAGVLAVHRGVLDQLELLYFSQGIIATRPSSGSTWATSWSDTTLPDPARLNQEQTFSVPQQIGSVSPNPLTLYRDGNANVSLRYSLAGAANDIYVGYSTANVYAIGTSVNLSSNTAMTLNVMTGNLTVAGTINRTSDAKFKNVTGTVEVTQEQLDSLELVAFEWTTERRKGQKDTGVIAQQVKKVFPTCVSEQEETDEDGEVIDTYLVVDYAKLAVHISLAQRKLDRAKRG